MSTRGLFGFRKNGIDKTMYNHYDSYPEGLGKSIVEFCRNVDVNFMNTMFDRIEMVIEGTEPTDEQIKMCQKHNLADVTVSTQNAKDWYCLIHGIQGDLGKLADMINEEGKGYMIDNHTFILDSLFCEWAYIINLDTNQLEVWQGFQTKPDETNRYGTEACKDIYQQDTHYYPCKLVIGIPLGALKSFKDEDEVVKFITESTPEEEYA